MAHLIYNGNRLTFNGKYIDFPTSSGSTFTIDYGLDMIHGFGSLNYIRVKENGDIVSTVDNDQETDKIVQVNSDSDIIVEYSFTNGSFVSWTVNGDSGTYGEGPLNFNNINQNYTIRLLVNWR